MTAPIRLILCLVVGLMQAVSAPAMAQDSSLTPLTSRYQLIGWEAVGRVEVYRDGQLRSTCTGTLIAKDLVLTAAHCVWLGKTLVSAEQVVFRAGYLNGSSIAASRVARLAVPEDYLQVDQPTVENVRLDVALLELTEKIDSTQANPFSVHLPDAGSEVSLVSYGQKRNEYLSWQKRCSVLENYQNILAFSCSATFGTSGAPVFDRSNGRSRIVSIISSTGILNDEQVSFGMQLPELVAALKTQLGKRGGSTTAEAAGPGARKIGVGEGFGQTKTAGGAKFVKP